MLNLGNLNVKDLFLGSTKVSSAWLGKRKVWPDLPYDAEVEYLGITGVEQIETGVIPSVLDTYYLDFMSTATGPQCGIWSSVYGTWNAVPNKWLFLKLRHTNAQVQTWNFKPTSPTYTDITATTSLVNGRRAHVVFSLKDRYCSFDNGALSRRVNLTVGTPSDEQPQIVLRQGGWSGRIYGWVVDRDGTIIQDAVPVRFTNEQGQSEGAMYDKVSKQLFRNKGTGSFVIGPDVTQ